MIGRSSFGRPVSVKFDTTSFFREWEQIKKRSSDAGSYYAKIQARTLVRKLAFYCPMDTGRARAGFYPAALALGLRHVYSGRYPNQNEGGFVDNLKSKTNPSFFISNSVPYILTIRGHGRWMYRARDDAARQAQRHLERTYRRHLSRWAR